MHQQHGDLGGAEAGRNVGPLALVPDGAIGEFEVRTASGSAYLLDLGPESTVLRRPGMSRPTVDTGPLRLPGDFTRAPLTAVGVIALGQPLTLDYWDGTGVHRHVSSDVIAIAMLR